MVPSWRKLQKNNFTDLEKLAAFLELTEEQKKKTLSRPRFPLNVPVRLAEKMEKGTLDDPILRQFLPLGEELLPVAGFTAEPLQDSRFRKTPKTLHKYHGRALLATTSACAMNCRFCFRQNFPYEVEVKDFSQELAYLQSDPTITEVILSGGDPLSLSDSTLSSLLRSLEAISHITRIRFHTRFPIGIPERITEEFLSLLRSLSKQLFFIIHVNHPKELDAEVLASLRQLQKMGSVLSQTVLLKGVNDNEATFLTLCETLINCGIVPYYLHALDPVAGAAHFDLPEKRGHELIAYVQKRLSGYGVPRFVREVPGSESKEILSRA